MLCESSCIIARCLRVFVIEPLILVLLTSRKSNRLLVCVLLKPNVVAGLWNHRWLAAVDQLPR